MKTSFAFVFTILIASSFGIRLLEQYPITFDRKISLQQVLIQFQEALKSGGPLDDVTNLIAHLEQQVRDEQARHSAVAERQNKTCHEEFSFREKEIEDGTNALNAARAQKANCEASLEQAEADLAKNLNEQEQTQNTLDQEIQTRREQNQLFIKRVQDHNDAIDAVNECVAMLDEIFSGQASFVQLGKMTSKMLVHSVKIRKTGDYAPVLAVFAQIASDKVFADENSLNRVRQLLLHLKKNIDKSLQDYTNTEEKQKQRYERVTTDLRNRLANLKEREEKLRDHIADMKECIARQTEIIGDATRKVNRNTDLLNSAKKMCQTFFNEYRAATQTRNNELELLERVQQIIQRRYKQLSQYVLSRGMKSTAEWRKYKNQSVYVAPEEYEHESGEYNEAGAEQANYSRNESLEKLY